METLTIEQQAAKYVDLYEALLKRVNDDALAIAMMHELSKDRRMATIQAERGTNGGTQSGELASAKQKAYLKQLGAEVMPGLTKAAASQLIEEALAGQ